MGGSRPDYARQTQDHANGAGESSRGVGLRGFESHPPHFLTNPPLSQSIVGEIVSFALWMRKQGYKDSTVRGCVRVLKSVARRADLPVPESTKCYLAGAKVSEARKALIVQHLARFYTYKRIPFDKPHYVPVDTLPFIPI